MNFISSILTQQEEVAQLKTELDFALSRVHELVSNVAHEEGLITDWENLIMFVTISIRLHFGSGKYR